MELLQANLGKLVENNSSKTTRRKQLVENNSSKTTRRKQVVENTRRKTRRKATRRESQANIVLTL